MAFDSTRDDGGYQRQTYKGDWKCSDCGTSITELPFQPAPDRPIYCKDCWRNHRPPRRDFNR